MISSDTKADGKTTASISGNPIDLSHEFYEIVCLLLPKLSREALMDIVDDAEEPEEEEEESCEWWEDPEQVRLIRADEMRDIDR